MHIIFKSSGESLRFRCGRTMMTTAERAYCPGARRDWDTRKNIEYNPHFNGCPWRVGPLDPRKNE